MTSLSTGLAPHSSSRLASLKLKEVVMGTHFFYTEMLPARDGEDENSQRQLEIFRPSGENYICIRIGDLGEQDTGSGPTVRIEKQHAEELLDSMERALSYFGWVK